MDRKTADLENYIGISYYDDSMPFNDRVFDRGITGSRQRRPIKY
jgi:hypothetical protein